MFMNDSETDGIIMIGEIGGQLEPDFARWIKNNGTKPVVGFIAGQMSPVGQWVTAVLLLVVLKTLKQDDYFTWMWLAVQVSRRNWKYDVRIDES